MQGASLPCRSLRPLGSSAITNWPRRRVEQCGARGDKRSKGPDERQNLSTDLLCPDGCAQAKRGNISAATEALNVRLPCREDADRGRASEPQRRRCAFESILIRAGQMGACAMRSGRRPRWSKGDAPEPSFGSSCHLRQHVERLRPMPTSPCGLPPRADRGPRREGLRPQHRSHSQAQRRHPRSRFWGNAPHWDRSGHRASNPSLKSPSGTRSRSRKP